MNNSYYGIPSMSRDYNLCRPTRSYTPPLLNPFEHTQFRNWRCGNSHRDGAALGGCLPVDSRIFPMDASLQSPVKNEAKDPAFNYYSPGPSTSGTSHQRLQSVIVKKEKGMWKTHPRYCMSDTE